MKSRKEALTAALNNAKYFERVYAVFFSSMRKYDTVSEPRDTHIAFDLVYPDGTILSSDTETTVEWLRQHGRMTHV